MTGASKNKTGESLSIAAVRGDVQHLVRLGSGLFDLAVNRFAKGGDSLPDGRRLGQIRSLGRVDRVSGEFSRLLQMASVGLRVCLIVKHHVLVAVNPIRTYHFLSRGNRVD